MGGEALLGSRRLAERLAAARALLPAASGLRVTSSGMPEVGEVSEALVDVQILPEKKSAKRSPKKRAHGDASSENADPGKAEGARKRGASTSADVWPGAGRRSGVGPGAWLR